MKSQGSNSRNPSREHSQKQQQQQQQQPQQQQRSQQQAEAQQQPQSQQIVPMEVSFSAEKRKAPEPSGNQGEDHQNLANPSTPGIGSQEQPQPQSKLELDDLMAFMKESRKEMQDGFKSSRADISKVWAETREVKGIASQAAVDAHEAKTAVAKLEERVAKLERDGPPTHPRATGGKQADNEPSSEWHLLGGDEGNTIVLGGIKTWVSKQTRQEYWEYIETQMAADLLAQVASITIPAGRGKIVLLHLKKDPDGVAATRRKMLAFCRDFKAAKITSRDSEILFYTMPSKPFWLRQKEAKNALRLEAIKLMVPEHKRAEIEIEITKGRIFCGETMIGHRPQETGQIVPKKEALKKLFPDTDLPDFEKTLKELEVKKEAERDQS